MGADFGPQLHDRNDSRFDETMTAPPFDTLAACKRLEAAGFTRAQAVALVELIRDVEMGRPIKYPDEGKP